MNPGFLGQKTRRVEVCIYRIGVLGRFKEPPGLGRMPGPGGYLNLNCIVSHKSD